MPSAGRNEPCPCGSGKKYKHCHLREDELERRPRPTPAMAWHDRDETLATAMMSFAKRRFGSEWIHEAGRVCTGGNRPIEEIDLQLSVPWALYHHEVAGQSIAHRYRQERDARLAEDDRLLLERQMAAWLTVWEVVDVEAGRGLTVRDPFTGTSRLVEEQSGSRIVVKHDAVLGRVVDLPGLSIFSGMHPRPLPPRSAAGVVDEATSRCGLELGATTPDRMRRTGAERQLLDIWHGAVEELDRRPLPAIRNTDGDPLEFTTDRYSFDAGQRDGVVDRLAALEGGGREEGENGDVIVVFSLPGNKMHQDWDNTIVGRAVVSRTELKLETNSARRADALRRRVEEACGSLLGRRRRERHDIASMLRKSEFADTRDPQEDESEHSEEEMALVREYKERHYASWMEEPVPALGGQTPREAAATPKGRATLDLLLKEMENHECRRPPAERFDFSALRARLGLTRE